MTAIITINCRCGQSFKLEVIGETNFLCPYCNRMYVRRFVAKTIEDYVIEEEGKNNDRRY